MDDLADHRGGPEETGVGLLGTVGRTAFTCGLPNPEGWRTPNEYLGVLPRPAEAEVRLSSFADGRVIALRCRSDLSEVTGRSHPGRPLVVQFQGMIAEYERAQIAERSRRGKRHKAQQGVVNVLSGAPYGYRYVKKSDHSVAYYEVIEHEAQAVRMVFETYTRRHLSIHAIARLSLAQ
jgi:hypothetical protein